MGSFSGADVVSGRQFHARTPPLALAVAGPLLLAGCTDDPEPTPKLPDPTTSSPVAHGEESETPEEESAEDFIRRWADS